MHVWGDKNVDWAGIDSAANFLSDFCRKWGRLGGQSKEKYGTVRFYVSFGHISLHTLVYPGYMANQFPIWLWNLDCNYIGPALRFLFEKLFIKWQIIIYNKAYQKSLRKWPHLRAEILIAADHRELIKGTFRKEGSKTYILGWRGEVVGILIADGED